MISLNGEWKLKRCDKSEITKGKVPGSVYTDLLRNKLMPDPYYKDNEEKVRELSYYDYEYSREFDISKDILCGDRILLVFEGIDTIADICLNDNLIEKCNNFHIKYECDVKKYLHIGTNYIKVILYSPIKFTEKADDERSLWGVTYQTMRGYNHIRKPHYMFGWDWGPKLPDAGIWNNVYLTPINDACIKDIYVRQNHSDGKVTLDIECESLIINNTDLLTEIVIKAPDGKVIHKKSFDSFEKNNFKLCIDNPRLWWPNGLGEQPLYNVCADIIKNGTSISHKSVKIGLRTLTINRKPDKWGESFCFNINGYNIFAKGANYIPEDNILGLCTEERTEKLLKSCIKSNFNCIRVWGGGHYAKDSFMELCDKLGLIVWHDFMFACAVYELTDDFRSNIEKEIIYNLKRLRNHASLGLWCGNNEMELAWKEWGIPQDKKLKNDYFEQFEHMLPELVKKYSPDTFYWPASPSTEGGMVEPNSDKKGDAHYWDVWHGKKWFSDFHNYYFRFASEYGFQSFPCLKTINTFCDKQDHNIYSPIMEYHQKCTDSFGNNGNMIISNYLSYYYLCPKSFDKYIYSSQILQGDCLKEAITHFRRNTGRCMGSTYWQLNDSNPVTSWATIDYFGRWKAAQYIVKKCYAPILASAVLKDSCINVYVVNDTMTDKSLTLRYRIIHQDKGELSNNSISLHSDKLTAENAVNINVEKYISDSNINNIYFEYRLYDNTELISSDTLIFVKSKQFEYKKPEFTYSIYKKNNKTFIDISSDEFASRVGIEFKTLDIIMDDNYFELVPDISRTIKLDTDLSTLKLQKELRITSVYDIAE